MIEPRLANQLDPEEEELPTLLVPYPAHLAPSAIGVHVIGVPFQRTELLRALDRPRVRRRRITMPPHARSLSARGCRVLVAEDSPVNRAVILKMLDVLGTDAVCVGDGASAVEAWQQGAYDVILMDCQMPWMDGLQATQRIRALGGEIPIVALTASVLAGDRERCEAAGMNGFLSKPYTLQQVADEIERLLAER